MVRIRLGITVGALAAALAVAGCSGSVSDPPPSIGTVPETGQPASTEAVAESDAADAAGAAVEESVEESAEVAEGVDDSAGDAPVEPTAPSKSDPARYTKHVVQQAIGLYDSEGLEAALSVYSDPASIDGQWYVFIVDGDGEVIAHPDERRVGLDINGPIGTDVNGYAFGAQMLSADETGKWVPYVYANPASGVLDDSSDAAFEFKNAWVVRHDGLLFSSGWYISAEEFLPALIGEAAERFREGGLEAMLAFYNDPEGITAGLVPTVDYYNSTDTLEGYFSGIVASPDGVILAHFDPSLIGTDVEDLLGSAVRRATPEGTWISAEDNPVDAGAPVTMRMWVADVDGTLIGGGWYRLADSESSE